MSFYGDSGPLPDLGQISSESCRVCRISPRQQIRRKEGRIYTPTLLPLYPSSRTPQITDSPALTELLVPCCHICPSDRVFLPQCPLYTRWCDLCLLLILDLQQMPWLLGPGCMRSRWKKQRQGLQMPSDFNNRTCCKGQEAPTIRQGDSNRPVRDAGTESTV